MVGRFGGTEKVQAALALVTAIACLPGSAFADDAKADTRHACSEAYTAAQSLRDAHRLLAARDSLRVCAQSRCAAFIAKDCAAWLVDTEARLPRVVLAATDAGVSTADVTVTIDGAPLASRLDGRSLDVDPGPHTFAFTKKDGAKIERLVVVREGAGAQEIAVSFEAPAPTPRVAPAPEAPAAAPPAVRAQADAPPAPHVDGGFWTKRRVLGAGLGGGGVAAVVVGSVFGGLAIFEKNTQSADCPSAAICNRGAAVNAHSAAQTDGAVSTAAFIVGGALIAGGAAVMLTGGHDETSSEPRTLALSPSVGRDGAAVLVLGTF